MKKISSLLIILFVLSCKTSDTMNGSSSYWHDTTFDGTEIKLPEQHRALNLDFKKLKAAIDTSVEVTIPMPDGTNIEIVLKENSIMSKTLAQKFPDIKSYEVVEKNSLSGRVDINKSGFYAMIVNGEMTFFINPTIKKSDAYISYDKKYATKSDNNPFIDKVIKK